MKDGTFDINYDQDIVRMKEQLYRHQALAAQARYDGNDGLAAFYDRISSDYDNYLSVRYRGE